jgi:hypothetical protein
MRVFGCQRCYRLWFEDESGFERMLSHRRGGLGEPSSHINWDHTTGAWNGKCLGVPFEILKVKLKAAILAARALGGGDAAVAIWRESNL